MNTEEFVESMQVKVNIMNEQKREREIYARGIEAKAEVVGAQPCSVQDCGVRARYFSTYNQYCEGHMAIKGMDILKKVSA